MFSKMNLVFLQRLVLTIGFGVSIILPAQWAGSSSPAGSSKVVTNTNNRQTSNSPMKVYMGLGIGGYTSALTKAASYTYAPGYSSFNFIQATNEQSTSGVGFMIGFLGNTKSNKLKIGVELGGGYHQKDVDYIYYDYYDNMSYSSTGYIESIHLGVGVPVRYSFINKPEGELYVQGVLGYGLVDCSDDLGNSLIEGPLGIFYGGGSIGGRISVLFAELGFNSTGYLRLGLEF